MRIATRPTRLLLISALLAVGACSQPEAPQPASQAAPALDPAVVETPAEPAPAPVPQELVQAGVTLSVEQLTSDCNPDTHYRANVSWTISDLAKAAVEVRVDSAEGPLLAQITATQHSTETGDWVKQGTRFFLVGKESREVLATATAGPEICQ